MSNVTLATYVCSACGLEHKFATEPPLVCTEFPGSTAEPEDVYTIELPQ